MIGWKLNLWASKIGTGYSGNVLKPTDTPFGVGKGIIRWTDAEGQGTSPNSFSNIIDWLREEAAGIADYYVSVGITNDTDYLFIDRYGIDAASAGYVTDPASSTWSGIMIIGTIISPLWKPCSNKFNCPSFSGNCQWDISMQRK